MYVRVLTLEKKKSSCWLRDLISGLEIFILIVRGRFIVMETKILWREKLLSIQS